MKISLEFEKKRKRCHRKKLVLVKRRWGKLMGMSLRAVTLTVQSNQILARDGVGRSRQETFVLTNQIFDIARFFSQVDRVATPREGDQLLSTQQITKLYPLPSFFAGFGAIFSRCAPIVKPNQATSKLTAFDTKSFRKVFMNWLTVWPSLRHNRFDHSACHIGRISKVML